MFWEWLMWQIDTFSGDSMELNSLTCDLIYISTMIEFNRHLPGEEFLISS